MVMEPERLQSWWHKKPRVINVIVDNDSWIVPYARDLVKRINAHGDDSCFVSSYGDVGEADISFFIGCVKITPTYILEKSKKNLVVHESDLPLGKGFSPVTYQILEGKNKIPIKLLEMSENVDSGPILLEDELIFKGHELVDEIRREQGSKTIRLCLEYLKLPFLPIGRTQKGEGTFYKRRTPEDSRIDFSNSIKDIFNVLRVADNDKYPVFFEKDGHRYYLKVLKDEK
jgi:methionyl-tRNA formyltransferase